MKKSFLFLFGAALCMGANAQVAVESSATTNLISAENDIPITFKVNNMLAGYTGNMAKRIVSFGYRALDHNTTGTFNTAFGLGALTENITGSYNTAIGYHAYASSSGLSNVTIIGCQAIATASNQVRIGNSSVTSIGGYTSWSNISDKRAKKNIRANVPGLSFINQLQPVTYNLDLNAIDGLMKINRAGSEWDAPELSDIEKQAREAKQKQVQTGFAAQDVEAAAKSIGYNFSGVDVDESGIYGLRYAEFVVPLVKAVQELSEQNKRLQAQIDELKAGRLPELRSETAGTGIESAAATVNQLYQNNPNPFSTATEIRYSLAGNVVKANLYIYDMQGKQIRNIPNLAKGDNYITINGSELSAGMYIYTLIADGQEVATKRMILTE